MKEGEEEEERGGSGDWALASLDSG